MSRSALLATFLALTTVGGALAFNNWAAGGADAYGYVTHADRWLRGRLRIDMPMAADAPWPDAIGTLTPFAHRATADGRALVPVTAPGLPLIMAGFKAIGGHAAMFVVTPICAGLLVWSVFLIGRRLGSDALGLAAAWLVATSPTVLSMSKWVMSDVPAAAFWAWATALILVPTKASAAGAGACASVALLIRPNLLPVAAILGAWGAWRDITARRGQRGYPVLAFAAALLPGCLAVAAIQHRLYGSPLASGYGSLESLFSTANIAENVRRYGTWLVATQTPLAVAGAVALFIPWRRLWPTADARRGAALLALVMLAVFAAYVAYRPFDAWWYLRFLLPAWPALCVGTSALLLAPAGHRAWLRALSSVLVIGLGINGLVAAERLGVWPPGEGERRYATIAELVARVTDPSAVVFTTAHAGTLRYYGGRLTVRFDVLDPAWLDRAIEWLAAQGRHPYILVEDWELREFEQRFREGNRHGRLVTPPVLVYEAYHIGGRVYLFDPLNPAAATWHPVPIRDPRPRCPRPAIDR